MLERRAESGKTISSTQNEHVFIKTSVRYVLQLWNMPNAALGPKRRIYTCAGVNTCKVPKVLEALLPSVRSVDSNIFSYNRWKDRTFCVFGDGSKKITVQVKVQVTSPTGCRICPEKAKCQFWLTDSTGRFRGDCTATTYASHTNLRFLYSVMPWPCEVDSSSCILSDYYKFKPAHFQS